MIKFSEHVFCDDCGRTIDAAEGLHAAGIREGDTVGFLPHAFRLQVVRVVHTMSETIYHVRHEAKA